MLEATSVEESGDPSLPLSTELPLDYSTDPQEEGMSPVENTGVQEGEQTTWELSGEPSTESAPEPSVEPSKEPAQKSTTEISGKTHFFFIIHIIVILLNFLTPVLLPFLH